MIPCACRVGLKRLGVMNADEDGDTGAASTSSTSSSSGSGSSESAAVEAGAASARVSAAVGRAGAGGYRTSVLSTEEMLPAACQGAVGVICREEDEWVVR